MHLGYRKIKLAHVLALSFVAVLTAYLFYAAYYFPVNWDEGWTFCVAKNYVMSDHYGCQLMGQFTPPRLTPNWPLVIQSALMFKFAGLSYFAARLPMILYTLLLGWVVFSITRRWFGSGAAAWAIILGVTLGYNRDLNPLLLGTQVKGEVPMLLCIFLGCSLLERLNSRMKLGSMVGPAGLTTFVLSFAIVLKGQALPFLLGSLAFTAIALYLVHKRRVALVMAAIVVAVYPLEALLTQTQLNFHTNPSTNPSGAGVQNLISTILLVTQLAPRLQVLDMLLTYGWPMLIGLGVYFFIALETLWKTRAGSNPGSSLSQSFQASVAQLFLFGTAALWLSWSAALAFPFSRYLFPGLILALPFTGHIADLFWTWLTKNALKRHSDDSFLRRALGCAVAPLFLAHLFFRPLILAEMVFESTDSRKNFGALIAFLNSTPESTVIETYESQLFYLLNRKFHYPPDQLHADAFAVRTGAAKSRPYYNPLESRPDLIVDGIWSRVSFGVYSEVIKSGRLKLCRDFGDDQIYATSEAAFRRLCGDQPQANN